jgi:hypothetical protein
LKNLFPLSYLLGIEEKGVARGHPARTPPSPSILRSPHCHRPPTGVCHPADTLALPHIVENRPSHPTPPLDVAMATEDTKLRQSTTVHLPSCHLTASTVLTHQINSPSQFCSSVTVHRRPPMPT